jgi:hypothetical protein
MDCDLVQRVLVDTFNDINLTILRPRWTDHPKRGPDATYVRWDVCEIANDEGTSIVALVCAQTDGVASDSCTWVENCGRVDTDVKLTVAVLNQTRIGCGG